MPLWFAGALLLIALLGVVMVVLLALHLWRRLMALFAELEGLGDRAGELGDLLAALHSPDELAAARRGAGVGGAR